MDLETLVNLEQKAEKLVEREVIMNMTPWIEDLLNHPDHDYYEEAFSLTHKINYEDSLVQEGWELDPYHHIIFKEESKNLLLVWDSVNEEIDQLSPLEWEEKKENYAIAQTDLNQKIHDFLENHLQVDPYDYTVETLEYWAVNEFLARDLARLGEPVEEIYGSYIWGRQTSGQALVADGVIQNIADKVFSS